MIGIPIFVAKIKTQ